MHVQLWAYEGYNLFICICCCHMHDRRMPLPLNRDGMGDCWDSWSYLRFSWHNPMCKEKGPYLISSFPGSGAGWDKIILL